jgi:predicted acylesterase/phospholipase RssA
VLVELEARAARPVAELFDLIAGTSAGAILALALSVPDRDGGPRYAASEVYRLYLTRGAELFPSGGGLRDAVRLLARRQPGAPASTPVLEELLGETRFGDAACELIVPTFDLGAGAPLILRSEEFRGHPAPLMREVALATSAVPTRFPAVELRLGSRAWTLAHGGLAANNPSLFAYTAALAKSHASDVVLVSLGTGHPAPDHHLAARPSRSYSAASLFGAARAFDLHMDSSSEAQHRMVEALLAATGYRHRYWRIQTALDGVGPQTHGRDPRAVEALQALAEDLITGANTTLEELSAQLVA